MGEKYSLHFSVNEAQTTKLIIVVKSLTLELPIFLKAFSHVLHDSKQKAVQFSVQIIIKV